MITSQPGKSAGRARWLSTGHDRARPDNRHPPQIVRQVMEFDAIRRSFFSRSTAEQLVAPARSKSASSPAALKSHRACGTALRSLPWRLSDAGRRIGGAIPHAAGIRNPSQQRKSVPARARRSSPKNRHQLSRKHSALQRSSSPRRPRSFVPGSANPWYGGGTRSIPLTRVIPGANVPLTASNCRLIAHLQSGTDLALFKVGTEDVIRLAREGGLPICLAHRERQVPQVVVVYGENVENDELHFLACLPNGAR